jgi:hypothetical protein
MIRTRFSTCTRTHFYTFSVPHFHSSTHLPVHRPTCPPAHLPTPLRQPAIDSSRCRVRLPFRGTPVPRRRHTSPPCPLQGRGVATLMSNPPSSLYFTIRTRVAASLPRCHHSTFRTELESLPRCHHSTFQSGSSRFVADPPQEPPRHPHRRSRADPPRRRHSHHRDRRLLLHVGQGEAQGAHALPSRQILWPAIHWRRADAVSRPLRIRRRRSCSSYCHFLVASRSTHQPTRHCDSAQLEHRQRGCWRGCQGVQTRRKEGHDEHQL